MEYILNASKCPDVIRMKENEMTIELWIDDGNPWYLSPEI